jgi:hypothetical protein
VVTGREGSNAALTARFAAVRVRPAHRDYWRATLRPEEWSLIEWPEGEKRPTKYWLSTLPEDTVLRDLVDLAKLRWRIERDDQEFKQEIGLGHFEGRGWRGFHHHATLCLAASWFPSGAGFPLSARPAHDRQSVPLIESRPASWLRPSAPNATSPSRSPPSGLNSSARSCEGSHDVPAATQSL